MIGRKGISTLIVAAAGALTVQAQQGSTAAKEWSAGTAHVLPKGRWEKGLFQPLRMGLSGRLEWSIHPLGFFLIPHVRIKADHGQFKGWQTAIRHSVAYPTPLLRRLQTKGLGIQALAEIDFGGLITGDPDVGKIPQMVMSRHEIMITRQIGSVGLVTAKGGVALALKDGGLDERTSVDLPIVYPRLGVLYNGFGLNLGVDIVRPLLPGLKAAADGDLLLIPGLQDHTALEHKGLLVWTKSRRFQLTVGYKLVRGEYPFGTQWHLLPLFDLQWGRSGGSRKP